jgi:hypothetical protein
MDRKAVDRSRIDPRALVEAGIAWDSRPGKSELRAYPRLSRGSFFPQPGEMRTPT